MMSKAQQKHLGLFLEGNENIMFQNQLEQG